MIEESAGWPVNFDITGPICARACKLHILRELDLSGHHDWPVMSIIRSRRAQRTATRMAAWPSGVSFIFCSGRRAPRRMVAPRPIAGRISRWAIRFIPTGRWAASWSRWCARPGIRMQAASRAQRRLGPGVSTLLTPHRSRRKPYFKMRAALSQGRGWTATGAFSSRCGPGEGSARRTEEPSLVLDPAILCPCASPPTCPAASSPTDRG